MIFEEIPLIMLVKVFEVVETVLLFMMVPVADCTPFTRVSKLFEVVDKVLEFTKLVLTVEITPFTFEVNMKLLEVVAILIRLEIVVVGTLVVEVIPFMIDVSI